MKTPLMSSKSGGKAPHCKVCGDESSGFHYGVDSCEGCKGFFRRCITQGMNHKCANEEKCEITPFTRNSCQYCRLKKCFEVGMSREASRLGRRPKRLKEVGGEGSGGSRSHGGNLPIAPYPSPQELYKLRMAELQQILQTNGTFKAELMQAFLSAAKASFQEHSKSGGVGSGEGQDSKGFTGQQQQMMDRSGLGSLNQTLVSGANTSSASDLPCASTDSAGLSSGIGGLSGVDSPSSMNSPGGSMIDFSNLAALDNFLFEQGMPSTPGGGQQSSMEAVSELQTLNSPFSLSNVSLDPVLAATSPLSEMGVNSPLVLPTSSSMTNGGGPLGSESLPLHDGGLNSANLLNVNLNAPSTSAATSTPPQPPTQLQQYQQYQQQQQPLPSPSLMSPSFGNMQVKTEPSASYSPMGSVKVEVKTEPVSPEPQARTSKLQFEISSPMFLADSSALEVDVNGIMEEVRQTPSETRRLLIEQVTDAVVEAHLATTINTYKAIEEANRRITAQKREEAEETTALPDLSKLKLEADSMWRQFISAMVPEITNLVKFCKKLPGFAEIDQDDQIRLIKQGSFEVMLARFSLLVNDEEQTMLDPTLSMRSHRQVIREMPMGEFLDEFFFMSSQFNPLKLTDGEVGLFTSILIICPYRKGLKNQPAISKIQSLFQQALYFLMKHNHPNPDEKFRQLMGLISTFHRINEEHFKALTSIRMKTVNDGAIFPDLHKEIFDGSV